MGAAQVQGFVAERAGQMEPVRALPYAIKGQAQGQSHWGVVVPQVWQ